MPGTPRPDTVFTKRQRIAELARNCPDMAFTNPVSRGQEGSHFRGPKRASYRAAESELILGTRTPTCRSRVEREALSPVKVSQLSGGSIVIVRRHADIRAAKTRLAQRGR